MVLNCGKLESLGMILLKQHGSSHPKQHKHRQHMVPTPVLNLVPAVTADGIKKEIPDNKKSTRSPSKEVNLARSRPSLFLPKSCDHPENHSKKTGPLSPGGSFEPLGFQPLHQHRRQALVATPCGAEAQHEEPLRGPEHGTHRRLGAAGLHGAKEEKRGRATRLGVSNIPCVSTTKQS